MADSDLSPEVEKLRNDLDEIRRDLTAIARTVKELGTTRGQQAFANAEERITRELNERPLVTLLAAAGLGFVVGKLLSADH